MSLRCLVVDDSRAFLAAAAEFLERDGVTVAGVASTAEEAISRAAALQPDVILVDIMLGPDSGFDLVRRLLDEPLGRPTIILMSTHAEADFGELIVASGAACFLPKAELSAAAIRGIAET